MDENKRSFGELWVSERFESGHIVPEASCRGIPMSTTDLDVFLDAHPAPPDYIAPCRWCGGEVSLGETEGWLHYISPKHWTKCICGWASRSHDSRRAAIDWHNQCVWGPLPKAERGEP